MSKRVMRGLAVLGLVVAASGCNLDVFNPGAITEESLNDPTLMRVVVNGVANEFNQIIDNASFDGARLSDEMAGTGSYFQTGRLRRGVIDWEETAGDWGQIHETIWTAQQAWQRMVSLEGYNQETTSDAARAWLLQGFAHQRFGELFCQVVYSTGSELGNTVSNRQVAFDSALVSFGRAIDIGTTAGEDDIVMAAYAGMAQAYMGKGEWTNAANAADMVDIDFVFNAIYNQTTNSNFTFVETHQRAEGGLYRTYPWRMGTVDRGDGVREVDPLQDLQDPRAEWTECGTFDVPETPKDSDVTSTGACTDSNGADGVTAHYRQEKFTDLGSEIPVATGLEMRLIEAEAALNAAGGPDFATFAARINEVRAVFDLDPIAAPTELGALEYPIAYNSATGGEMDDKDPADNGLDALSILDGERHVTTWLEGRRVWDLHRWDHPFLDDGIVFWDVEPGGRASCYPVPEQECQLNDGLKGATLLTGVGTATQTCG